jgi:hypothetical protein
VTYIPREPIAAKSDVNMFLTRHRFLHRSVPHLPLSISHCWINADLEREKLRLGDLGFSEPPGEIEQLAAEGEAGSVAEKLPDMFKTKSNLDRRASQEPVASDVSSISSVGATKPATTPNSGPKIAAGVANGSSRPASLRGKKAKDSVILLKDRDWRGGDEEEMWWECQWDGMDGIGGTNKKGAKCFDKVRITWGWSRE